MSRPESPPSRAAAPALLPTVSIVEQAMAEARRVIGWVLAAVAVLVAALLLERGWLATLHQEAAQRHAEALRVASELRLQDHKLSSAAQLAVIAGDPTWVQRFDEQRPVLMRLLDEARSMAPPGAIDRFEAETGSAQHELDDMRQAAFEAVSVGAPDVARTIFEGDRYRERTALLQQAIADFSTATVAAAGDDLEALHRRSAGLGAALVVGIVLMGLGLGRRLARSRTVFLGAEQRVKTLAASDMLTGLPNRAALHDAMASAMARVRRDDSRLAVLMLDLDRFKPINDRHGHMMGDEVLREVARRLRTILRAGEVCARYGGDEFVVLVDDDGDSGGVHHLADRLVRSLSAPITHDGLSVAIGASVGIARFPADGNDADELLRRADSALYRAKGDGAGGVCDYDVRLDERVADRAALEQALREGITRGEFVAHFQPVVDLASGRVQGVELLARWRHPTRGLLPPGQFIELAEETGQIGPLTLALLQHACGELAILPSHWRLSINIAPQQLQDETLVPQLLSILAEHDVSAARLDLELTESALVRDTAAARHVMLAMREAGFTVTLDDFGTGYSSLAYLAELAFDKIKIDRSFVHTLRARPESAKVVDAIIGLSRSLGCPTVAEGIETEDDAARLLRMGCALGQGYLFGRPAAAADLVKHLAQRAGSADGRIVPVASAVA
jgi:diguanylate cyclase (GGDEF)-like protein